MRDDQKKFDISENELFGDSPCLDLDELLNYHREELSPEERYRVEKHLLDCELCSLALEQLPGIENKENIRQNVDVLNKAIRERAAAQNADMQTARKLYFLTAVLGFLQRSMRYRYMKYGTVILSAAILVSASILMIKFFQTPGFYEIPGDEGQIRSGARDFFDDFREPASATTPAGRYFYQAGQFAQSAQYDSVIVYLKSASELYYEDANWKMYVRCYNALAEYSRLMGNYRQARDFIEKAIATGTERLGKEHPEVVTAISINGRIPGGP